MIIQNRKYDTYKDSGIEWIGEIPQKWDLIRLQFCIDEIKEKNQPIKSEQVLSLVKDKGVMLYEEKGNVGNVAKEDITEYKLAYPNTLILNSMNILIGSVGISNYFGCVSPVYYVFKETDKSDLRFINYIFTTREFQKELRRYANGIMEIRLRVSAHDIFKRKITCPNKQEQIKIADYLDKKCGEIDRVVETEKAVIEKLKEYKQSIITEAVTKGLDKSAPLKDSGIEWIGKIPQHWQIAKLKNISLLITDGAHVSPETENGVYDFVSTVDVKQDNIDFENCLKTSIESYNQLVKNNCNPKNGDILISKDGTVGKTVVIDYDRDFVVASSLVVIRLLNLYNKYFINYVLKSNVVQEQLNLFMKGAGLKRVSVENNKKLNVVIPSKDEQQQIAEYLDKKCSEIDKAIADKEQVIEKFTEYKKSLIYECVTGKRGLLLDV